MCVLNIHWYIMYLMFMNWVCPILYINCTILYINCTILYINCTILYNNNIIDSVFLYIACLSWFIFCVGGVHVKIFNYVNYTGSISVTMTSLYGNKVVVFSLIDFMQSSSYERLFTKSDYGMYSILHMSYELVHTSRTQL